MSPTTSDMRLGGPGFRSDGIGNVSLKGKYVATVRYRLYHCQTVGDAQKSGGHAERTAVAALTDGDIEVLESEAPLYADVLYTLHLEDKYRRDCDFCSNPIDIVAGRYHIEVRGNLHPSRYRKVRT